MASDPIMHYAGALAWRVNKRVVRFTTAGYPPCCSGPRAVKIAERGECTRLAAAVTCPRCLGFMEKTRAFVAEGAGEVGRG